LDAGHLCADGGGQVCYLDGILGEEVGE
jgi:hypothetical protein